MSRIGKLPISVPQGVKVRVENRAVIIEGSKGSERHELPPAIDVELRDGTLNVTRKGDTREGRALHGLTRRLLANIIQGVSTGFVQNLEIIGVGYRAEVKGDTIQFALGYSHPIVYQLPPQVARQGRQADVDYAGGKQPPQSSARWPRRSAACGRPSPTRARESSTPMNVFAVRRARPPEPAGGSRDEYVVEARLPAACARRVCGAVCAGRNSVRGSASFAATVTCTSR